VQITINIKTTRPHFWKPQQNDSEVERLCHLGGLLLKLSAWMSSKGIYMAKKGTPEDCHCKRPSKTDQNISLDDKKFHQRALRYQNKSSGDTSGNV